MNDTNADLIRVLKMLRDAIVREFSYDGEDPKGVKRYQYEVDAADELIAQYENPATQA